MDSSSKRFYNLNQIRSVIEATDNSGSVLGQLAYDPFGRPSQLQGSYVPDFGFDEYYLHARSGLNLTLHRAYSPQMSRWLNRDPLGERAAVNLYDYVSNKPIDRTDPTGMLDAGGVGVGVGVGAGTGIAILASIPIFWLTMQNMYKSLLTMENWDDMDQCQQQALDCVWQCMQKKKCNKDKKKPEDVEKDYRDCMNNCWTQYQQCVKNKWAEEAERRRVIESSGWGF